MIDIVVITGFLGSGKTTFIQNYVRLYQGSEPVVIIENDYGSTGVDALALASTKTIVNELDNGCICCSLGDDLLESLERIIRENNPVRIIIEPSGVAMLSDLLLKLNHPRMTRLTQISSVICMVDGYRYKMYLENFDDFYENQIQGSDVIVLTHMDLKEEKEVKVQVNDSAVRIYNRSQMDDKDYLDLIEHGTHTSKILVKTNRTMKLKTIELHLSETLKRDSFSLFLEWMFEHYEIVRIKGNIRLNNETVSVQYNWSQLTYEPTFSRITGLTVIGHGLDQVLKEEAKKL